MSQTQTTDPTGSSPEMHSALFAQLVMQQANLAMMLLGKVPHPETGQITKDLETAQLFIDQLEMLEAKTKGNLTVQEANLLKQSLMSLRLAFVEAVDSPEMKKPGEEKPQSPAPSQAAPTPSESAEESHKKFSKKY